MMSFAAEYKRSRPSLGTFFQISLDANSHLQNLNSTTVNLAVNDAYNEVERLHEIFSRFTSTSDVAKLNACVLHTSIQVTREFYYLLQLAEKIWRLSEGTFNMFFPEVVDFSESTNKTPFVYEQQGESYFISRNIRQSIDLNGIAKGYAVDLIASKITKSLPGVSGVINAGGDLRFFNTQKRCVNLRLGPAQLPLCRTLIATADAVATSSPSLASYDSSSSTRYSAQLLRSDLTSDHSVVVMSNCCCIADSLTKVALYAKSETIESCANKLGAQVLLFDPRGSLVETYGSL